MEIKTIFVPGCKYALQCCNIGLPIMGVEAEFGATLYRPLDELQFLAPMQSLHFTIIQNI